VSFLKILQTVTVKQVITETSKAKMIQSLKRRIDQLKKECDQLRFERKKLEKMNKQHRSHLLTSFDKEIEKRKEKIKMIVFQIEQLRNLPIGSEVYDGEVQALVDIQVGDNWEEITREKTIVIKEGYIVEIR
jgi:predicted RNase H-like nuclease (RuvC/YqgF family)